VQGTNGYPSRTYPEYPTVPTPDPALGGAHGPAAIPARILTNYPPPGPPSSPPHSGKGPIAQRQRGGLVVSMPGRSPGEQNIGEVQNEVFHETIPWHRPWWANWGPVAAFHTPTQQPSWTANSTVVAGPPRSPLPYDRHRQTAATVVEEFGTSRDLFPLWGTRRPLSGMDLQGRRWAAQAKTMNPHPYQLSVYGLAGSYGQTTKVLQTQPVNQAGNATGFGAY